MEIILDLKIETSSCVVYVFIPILCLVTFKFIFDLIAYPQENDLQALWATWRCLEDLFKKIHTHFTCRIAHDK